MAFRALYFSIINWLCGVFERVSLCRLRVTFLCIYCVCCFELLIFSHSLILCAYICVLPSFLICFLFVYLRWRSVDFY